MKIKIIDLLNKLVNGEEMPQKIMFDTCLYTYDEQEETYYNEEEETLWQNYNFKILTDEVEIIEEPKKILGKLDWNKNDFTYLEGNLMSEETADMLMEIQDKINNIIDILDKGE